MVLMENQGGRIVIKHVNNLVICLCSNTRYRTIIYVDIPIHVHNIIAIKGILRNLPSQMLPNGVLKYIYYEVGSLLVK